jgi:hypothetical protein
MSMRSHSDAVVVAFVDEAALSSQQTALYGSCAGEGTEGYDGQIGGHGCVVDIRALFFSRQRKSRDRSC